MMESRSASPEVAEYEAARILGVQLTPARQTGYVAIEKAGGRIRRLQIKGRLGSIDITKTWDAVLLVLLDENLDATEIHETKRKAVLAALAAPGSRARNERGTVRATRIQRIRTILSYPAWQHIDIRLSCG
jgi:hypothetical protein